MLEALAIAACVASGVALWSRAWSGAGRAAGALGIVVAAAILLLSAPRSEGAPPGAAAERASSGYVSSTACRSCHPGEYASYHRTYHRTMTQLATRETVLAPFAPLRLEIDGRRVELEPRGDELWATLPDPNHADFRQAPLVRRRVVMTTGSHHYQGYWVTADRGNELRLFPAVYLIAERRFVPRQDAFLQPPSAHARAVRWNSNCVQCHSVAGRPQHDEATDRFETEAVELGVSCESCHGPGGEHVARHQNPLTRWVSRYAGDADDSIVQPAKLGAERGSEVCGQCHSYFVPRDEGRWWESGFAESFRAGEPLAPSRLVLDHGMKDSAPELIDADFDSLFWPDGTIRIGGREYNALVTSPCYERGHGERRLSCTSCHSLHESDPEDQLSELGRGDGACASCHQDVARRGSEHTHHPPGAAGSRCYSCHMPYTSYALFKGIRSHRVTSPDVASDLGGGPPNACTLCHTDRTLGWASEHLSRWYGKPAPELPPEDTSTALRALLSGDAAERAIAAFALGQGDARRASARGFQPAALSFLLDDPYSAVRLVAYRALLAQPGFADFEYDFLAPPAARKAAVERALQRFHALPKPEVRPELLLRADGSVDRARIEALRAQRDDRPITIAE